MTVQISKMPTDNVIIFDFEEPTELSADMHQAMHEAQSYINTSPNTLYILIDFSKLPDIAPQDIDAAMQQTQQAGHGWHLGAAGTQAVVLCSPQHLKACREAFQQQGGQKVQWYSSIEDAMDAIRSGPQG